MIVLFGDASGWLKPLEDALQEHGASLLDCHIPKKTTIVHLGDLVHKGPDSDELVLLVNQIMEKYPEQWVQLMGNHELHHLSQQKFWHGQISKKTVKTLKSWLKEEKLQAAYDAKGWLATHGGVTSQFWKTYLKATEAKEAAEELNQLFREDFKLFQQHGEMLSTSHFPHYMVPGPIWASCHELYSSWLVDPKFPMQQIHGHTRPFKNWNKTPDFDFRYNKEWLMDYSYKKKHIGTQIGKHKFYAIDPGLNKNIVTSYSGFKIK